MMPGGPCGAADYRAVQDRKSRSTVRHPSGQKPDLAEHKSVATQDMTRNAARLSTQREAASILHDIVERLEVRPMPDGRTLFAFWGDAAMHDRVCEWGSAEDDLEPEDGEEDERDLPRLGADGEVRELRAALSHELAKILARKGVRERRAQLHAA